MAGVAPGHLIAGIFGGVVSLWFTPGAGWWRCWISFVAGVALAVYGAPLAIAIALLYWPDLPYGLIESGGNLAALVLGATATDILSGGRGLIKVMPAWIYERITGKELAPEACATCDHLRQFNREGKDLHTCDLHRTLSDGCEQYTPRTPKELDDE